MAKDVVSRLIVGKELARVREKAGITQEDLAEFLGRSVGVVDAVERGQVRVTPRYIRLVLEGCGRPELWAPSTMPPGMTPDDSGRTSDY